jgi:hypothetical protein
MKLIKLLFAVYLMFMSGHAMALFMPDGSQSITDNVVITNNVGC